MKIKRSIAASKYLVTGKSLCAVLLAGLCLLAAWAMLFRAGRAALRPGSHRGTSSRYSGGEAAAGGAASRKSPSAQPVPAWKDLPAGEYAKRSKKIADLAVEKIRSGDLGAAEKLLRRALAADRYNPEALISLCGVLMTEDRKAEALVKCEAAASAAYASPKKNLPALRMIASEAEFASYKLLLSLGREDEAGKTLCKCSKLAPRDWPGLAATGAELKKLPGFLGCFGL